MKMIRMASTVSITMAGIKRKKHLSLNVYTRFIVIIIILKRWDEWVPESRILKLNEAGLEKQKSLQLENQTE